MKKFNLLSRVFAVGFCSHAFGIAGPAVDASGAPRLTCSGFFAAEPIAPSRDLGPAVATGRTQTELLEYGSGYELGVVHFAEPTASEAIRQSLYFRVWGGQFLSLLGNAQDGFSGRPNIDDLLWERAIAHYPRIELVSFPLPFRDRLVFLRALSRGSDAAFAVEETQSFMRLHRLGYSQIRKIRLLRTEAQLLIPSVDDKVVGIRVVVGKDAH
jgi:hypothetical protein